MFREAARGGAAAIVLFHNHPSGDPTPSDDDVALTSRLVRAGELMGIAVLDHVILAETRFCSLREAGKLRTGVGDVSRTTCCISIVFPAPPGDMILGALLDLGLPLDALKGALGSLAIDYGDVVADRVLRAGRVCDQVPTDRHESTGRASTSHGTADDSG